jgi:hypothetical protein
MSSMFLHCRHKVIIKRLACLDSNWEVVFGKIFAFYSQNHMKPINTLCCIVHSYWLLKEVYIRLPLCYKRLLSCTVSMDTAYILESPLRNAAKFMKTARRQQRSYTDFTVCSPLPNLKYAISILNLWIFTPQNIKVKKRYFQGSFHGDGLQ